MDTDYKGDYLKWLAIEIYSNNLAQFGHRLSITGTNCHRAVQLPAPYQDSFDRIHSDFPGVFFFYGTVSDWIHIYWPWLALTSFVTQCYLVFKALTSLKSRLKICHIGSLDAKFKGVCLGLFL